MILALLLAVAVPPPVAEPDEPAQCVRVADGVRCTSDGFARLVTHMLSVEAQLALTEAQAAHALDTAAAAVLRCESERDTCRARGPDWRGYALAGAVGVVAGVVLAVVLR